MRRPLALGAGVFVALAVAAPALASDLGGREGAARVEVTVGYSSRAALRIALKRYPATVVRTVPSMRVAVVRPFDPMNFVSQLAHQPGIRFAQRVVERSTTGGCACPALETAPGKSLPWEWQFFAAREDAVPDWVLRAASSVTIAVIDTGADLSAPDLAAKAPLVWNERTGTTDVHDTAGHGTFVAALAAASMTNNNGIAGFGGDAQLMIIKVGVGDGSLTDVDEATAITYAVDHGARIINLSFGGVTTSAVEKHAIDYAVSKGALIVAAAGNEFLQGNPPEYPAALLQPLGSNGGGGRGLSVGASTQLGMRAAFSNSGTYLSLAAPGDNVFSNVSFLSLPSRFPRVQLPNATGLYGYASGSSFAAPEVSGAAALVWAANPLLDATAVAQILKDTASGQSMWTPELGYGVIDVSAAVASAAGVQQSAATAALKLAGAERVPTTLASKARRKVSMVASLASLAPSVAPSARTLLLQRFNGYEWRTVGEAPTSTGGIAAWLLQLKRGSYKMRAVWSGSTDLKPAVSGQVTLVVK